MLRSTKPRLLALALLLGPLTACAGKEHILLDRPQPRAADLTVEAEPVMPEAAITDDTVNAKYNSDVEAWGQRGWQTVGRLCRWFVTNGSTGLNCPPASKPTP